MCFPTKREIIDLFAAPIHFCTVSLEFSLSENDFAFLDRFRSIFENPRTPTTFFVSSSLFEF